MDAKRELPIAVIDSGVGGISVLRELVRIMPRENYIYFGDSKNAPYGSKSKGEVLSLTRKNLAYLQERGIKALVIACNTATSAAAKVLREENPELIISILLIFNSTANNHVIITFAPVIRRTGHKSFNSLCKK